MKNIKEIEKEAEQKVQEMLTVQKELSIVIDVQNEGPFGGTSQSLNMIDNMV